MSFLYPQFLFGLFALSIPIIIHLFNFRRTKRVYYSNTALLQNIKIQSRRQRNLKHLLILLARLLALFFLVIAFAQPILPPDKVQGNDKNVFIYLDNSMSMTNEVEEGMKAFDKGTELVNQIVQQFPDNTRFHYLTNTFSPFSNFPQTAGKIENINTELTAAYQSRPFHQILDKFKSLNKGGENIHYFISDFQKSTLGNLSTITFDSTGYYNLLPISHFQSNNIYLDSVYMNSPVFIDAQKNQLNAILKNQSKEAVNDLVVNLYVDDVQSASGSVDIPAGATGQVTFDLGFSLDTTSKCRIGFEDFPVTYDNDFYLTLKPTKKINVTEIRTDKSSNVLSAAFGNDDLFNFTSYNADNVDYNQIRSADLLIINEIPTLQGPLLQALSDYRTKGTIWMIPSTSPNISTIGALIGSHNYEKYAPNDTALQQLATVNQDNPFFQQIFDESSSDFTMPHARPVIRWQKSGNTLLSFKDGTPYLSSWNNNQFYLLGSPLGNGHTQLQRHALFIPIVYKMAILSINASNDLYYYTNDPVITLQNMDNENAQSVFKLAGNDFEVIPEQMFSGSELKLDVSQVDLTPGFYQLFSEKQRQKLLAFNLYKAESDLENYPVEELKAATGAFDNVNVLSGNNIQNVTASIEQDFFGKQLWHFALILALVFLLAEVLIIRFMK